MINDSTTSPATNATLFLESLIALIILIEVCIITWAVKIIQTKISD